jgi:hypothetical protein
VSTSTGDRVVAWVLAAAVAAQGLALVVMDGLGLRSGLQVVVVTLALAAAVGQTWRVRERLNHRVDMLLVMLAAGGLGMVVGTAVDQQLAEAAAASMAHGPAGHHHGHPSSPWAAVWTWMTGLMLLFSIPASIVWTRCAALARHSRRRWVSTHLVGNAAMVVAMVWFGHWFGHSLGRLMQAPATGHHVAMVIGMLLGMEAGMFLGEAVLGLAPWKELNVTREA